MCVLQLVVMSFCAFSIVLVIEQNTAFLKIGSVWTITEISTAEVGSSSNAYMTCVWEVSGISSMALTTLPELLSVFP